MTSTIQSPRNTEEEIHRGPQTEQENEFASNDTANSTNNSDIRMKVATMDIYLQLNLSDNYVTYFIQQKDLSQEAGLTEADIQRVQPLVSNESLVLQSISTEHLVDKVKELKSVVQSFRTQNNFTMYTVQTDTSKNISNVLVETAGNSSLRIILISLNETENITQEVEAFLSNLNVTYNSDTTNHSLAHTNVFLTNNTKSTDIIPKRQPPWRFSTQFRILKYYIDPAVYILILVVGLFGNGMLLFIFIRHRKLRTAANIMIINLVICDIINLSINAPLHFHFTYEGGSKESLTVCKIVLVIRQYIRCTAALAVITLIIHRFCIIVPAFKKSTSHHRTSVKINILSITAVWVLPVTIAFPSMYEPKFYEPICFVDMEDNSVPYIILLNFVLYCVIMPSLMFGFSTLIARRLKQSVKNMPGEIRHRMQEESRIRSARIMMALAVVFVITYFPFHVWIVLARCAGVNKYSAIMIYALNFTKQLLFANGCFNPIAMFVVSSTFRKLLACHVTYSSEKGVYITKL
jgi:gastrin-releasing peptide receptor